MNLWDELAFEYDPNSPTRSLWMRRDKWLEIIKSTLLGCKNILDVGCGAGFPSVFLGKSFRVVGIDFSKKMLDIASRRAKEYDSRVSYIRADAHTLPFKEDSFDGVFCKFALWPLKDFKKAIKEMIRVLRPGGSIVILEVDRKTKDYPRSLKTRIIYPIYRLIKRSVFKQPDTKKIWDKLIKQTSKNPLVNSHTVTDTLRSERCKILYVQKDIKDKTQTLLGRVLGSSHEQYFLCKGVKLL